MYFAELAEHSTDEATRRTALRAEQRIWQEVLLHFHPYLSQIVGPFSRGYPDDNANQCTIVMMTMYAAMGEVTPFNPQEMLFPPPEGTFAHGPWDFQNRSLAAQVAPAYHLPTDLANACLYRPMPFASMGNNEYMATEWSPAGQTTVSTYMEENYGLGSFGSRLWAGQTVPLHLLYRRRSTKSAAPVEEHLAAIRSVYTRMWVSDQFDTMGVRAETVEKEIGLDHGTAFCVTHEGTAMLGYVPVYVRNMEKVATVRASAIFPLHHSRPDEIRFGSKIVCGFSASYANLDWCFIRDGDVYIGLYPLVAKQEDAMLCSTRFADTGKYGLISFFNKCGFHAKHISSAELRSMGNGMILEVGMKAKHGTFEKFIEMLFDAKCEHDQYGTEREMVYRREGLTLEMKYDFGQLNLRRAAVNGKIVSEAVKLETTADLSLLT
jgi:hypothetical protein